MGILNQLEVRLYIQVSNITSNNFQQLIDQKVGILTFKIPIEINHRFGRVSQTVSYCLLYTHLPRSSVHAALRGHDA